MGNGREEDRLNSSYELPILPVHVDYRETVTLHHKLSYPFL